MRALLLSAALFCLAGQLFAQEYVEYQFVEDDTVEQTFGPNLANHFGMHLNFTLAVGEAESDSAAIVYGNSHGFEIGATYKRKLNGTFAVGAELNYRYRRYRVEQDSTTKRVPTDLYFLQEELTFNDVSLQGFVRINFDGKKRGNSLGKYLDLGGYVSLMFSSVHRAELVLPNGLNQTFNATEQELTSRGLQYTETLAYGLVARVGLENFYFVVDQRLSDRFKGAYNFAEFPFTQLGIGLSF